MFYEAVFQPSEKMEYNEDARSLAGQKIAVEDGWIIDEGEFKGQRCYYIPNSTIGWIPKCDLKDLQPVPFVKWKDLHSSHGFDK